jgi:uncharacterized protein
MANEGQTARLSAGFCWRWSDPQPDGSLVPDVKIGLGPGIPKSNFWASDPAGIDQVGCVHGPGIRVRLRRRDLRPGPRLYRPRKGWIGQPEFSHDTVVKRAAKDDPARFTALVRNTYRVLLTRGLRGCAVYFEDEQTRDFVLSRVEWPEEFE